MLCILACHLCTEHSSPYVQTLAQVFNVGVQIFILISGFCFGLQGSIEEPLKWYGKRAKRIFFPYECFLLVLAVVYMALGRSFPLTNWLTCVFGVQGANVGVLGADQTWFITPLLIGYLLTPLFSAVYRRSEGNVKYLYCEAILLLLVPSILALFPSMSIHTVGGQVCFYGVAYIMGRTYSKWKGMLKPGIGYFFILVLAYVVRIAGRFLWDGSRLYDCIVVGYTQLIAALCLFLLFWSFLNEKKTGKVIRWICDISFEVYLYHYMFIVGPLSLMEITGSWLANSVLVLLVTAVVASLTHRVVLFAQGKCRSMTGRAR